MTSNLAVSLGSVSKKYALYDTKRHRILEALHPFRRTYHREFWALRDISLDIPSGQTVGILGMNGSGKSTLLKIITSVLQPTSGTVAVNGKVAALLELGAGFNPELTGRDNVVMNATLMGLAKDEILERMQQVEAFADIGEFFDQPMKTYSSGMFMRVGFAAAIHVDPEILVIDEALAVGDARFVEKCHRRIRDFQRSEKTILYVTHDRHLVPQICDTAVLLHDGRLESVGTPRKIVELYSRILAIGSETSAATDSAAAAMDTHFDEEQGQQTPLAKFLAQNRPQDLCRLNPTYNKNEFRYGNGGATIVDYLILDGECANPPVIDSGRQVDVILKIRFNVNVDAPIIGVFVKTTDGALAYGINSRWLARNTRSQSRNSVAAYRLTMRMDLCAGDWFLDLAVAAHENEMLDVRESVVHLRVITEHRCVGVAHFQTDFEELTASVLQPA